MCLKIREAARAFVVFILSVLGGSVCGLNLNFDQLCFLLERKYVHTHKHITLLSKLEPQRKGRCFIKPHEGCRC